MKFIFDHKDFTIFPKFNFAASKKTLVYENLMKLYENPSSFQLNSRSIRDITFNLNGSYKVPNMCEAFLKYIEKNSEYIAGDTVEKVSWNTIELCYFKYVFQVFSSFEK